MLELVFAVLAAAVGVFVILLGVLAAVAVGIFAAARPAIFVVRDLVVDIWPASPHPTAERAAILVWLSLVPVGWGYIIYLIAHALLPEHWFLALLYAGAGFSGYYFYYFTTSPQRFTWPYFVAQETGMIASFRLWQIELKFKIKLWWEQFKNGKR